MMAIEERNRTQKHAPFVFWVILQVELACIFIQYGFAEHVKINVQLESIMQSFSTMHWSREKNRVIYGMQRKGGRRWQ